MRILLITDDYPPQLGGIASYLFSLYGAMPSAAVIVSTWRRAWRAIARRPTVIHAGTLLPAGVVAMVLSFVTRLPYAVHVYGTDLATTRRSWVMQRLAIAALRHAQRVIVISDFGKEHAIALGVRAARIVKVAPPVDAERFTPIRREAGHVLLTVARLVPRKGHDLVLRALVPVLRRVPDVRYRIVGDGPDRARLERLAADLGVAHAVEFLGAVDDVGAFYRSCDLFVMPSREEEGEVEGFGIAFIEASASGKPVIGGRSGGVAEAVIDGETGLLVDPHDADALAEAIVALLADPVRAAALGERGRAWVVRHFDPRTAAARIAALAQEMEEEGR
jgi:phosphatidylinositol alpha-1,6-mannosyltransferase